VRTYEESQRLGGAEGDGGCGGEIFLGHRGRRGRKSENVGLGNQQRAKIAGGDEPTVLGRVVSGARKWCVGTVKPMICARAVERGHRDRRKWLSWWECPREPISAEVKRLH